jgi:hypothetical protein
MHFQQIHGKATISRLSVSPYSALSKQMMQNSDLLYIISDFDRRSSPRYQNTTNYFIFTFTLAEFSYLYRMIMSLLHTMSMVFHEFNEKLRISVTVSHD